MADFYEKLEYHELTNDIKMIADVCGMEAVRNLLRHLGGLQFYIPKITCFEKFVFKYMKDNHQHTIKDIAKELGVSEQYLKIVKKRCA